MENYIWYFFFSCFYFICARSWLVSDLKKLVINDNVYPKYYSIPRKWMKKFLKINYHMIPKHIYYESYFIFIYLLLGLFGTMHMLIFNDKDLIKHFLLIQIIFGAIERIISLILGKKLNLHGY